MVLSSVPLTIVFGAEAGLCSAALMFLDWLCVNAGKESFLQVTHGRRTPWLVCLWFLGAAVVAGLGSAISFYQQSWQAALLIGFTWTSFPKQASKFLQKAEDEQEPAEGGGI